MELDTKELWTAGGILLGFQLTSFHLRLTRELKFRDEGDVTWLPWADLFSLVSMLIMVLCVFLLPILGFGITFATNAFGISLILFAGYPFALAGHYELFTSKDKEVRKGGHCPFEEKVVLAVTVIVLFFYEAAFFLF
tara:strand:- start:21373 stop:21783 length:411 start_codon:yes stop_codon:yes gene_type:complete